MTKTLKDVLVYRAISRAETGLYFIDQCLNLVHRGGTDVAFSRSIYILFSFNFELILKSRVIISREGETKEELLKNLKHHDLKDISKELSMGELNSIDISKIEKKPDTDFEEYEVWTTKREKIIVQDLVDVRYDFVKDSLRKPDSKESERIKKEVVILLEMVKKIKSMIKI